MWLKNITKRLGSILAKKILGPPRPLWGPSRSPGHPRVPHTSYSSQHYQRRHRGRRQGSMGLVGAGRQSVVTSERKRTLREAAQNAAVTGISVAPRTLLSFAPGSGCVGRACSSLRPWRPGLTRQLPLPPQPHRPPRARAAPAPGRRPRLQLHREGFWSETASTRKFRSPSTTRWFRRSGSHPPRPCRTGSICPARRTYASWAASSSNPLAFFSGCRRSVLRSRASGRASTPRHTPFSTVFPYRPVPVGWKVSSGFPAAGPSRSRSIPWVGAREAKLTSCSWWGRKGSEWRHKMAATPGAGPPDPALPFFSCLQVAMATGQVLFHRFFYSKSFVKHSFEVSRAGAGVKGFLHPEIGRRGVVLAASFSRKEAVSLGLCTYFSPTRKCGLLELRAVLETRKWIQTPQVSN